MALGVMWFFLVSGSRAWGPLGQFAITTSSTYFLYKALWFTSKYFHGCYAIKFVVCYSTFVIPSAQGQNTWANHIKVANNTFMILFCSKSIGLLFFTYKTTHEIEFPSNALLPQACHVQFCDICIIPTNVKGLLSTFIWCN